MDIFDIDPNALIILVIMIIGGLRWLLEHLKGQRPPDQEEPDSATPFRDLYEEARRQIQERQGGVRPPSESRPLMFEPLAVPPPAKPASAPPPPLPPSARPAGKVSGSSSSQKAKAARPVLTPEQKAAALRIQERGIGARRRAAPSSGSGVRALLSSPGATRKAIVLREILGPPKGAA